MKTSKIVLGFALIASGLFYLSLSWPRVNGVMSGPITETKNTASTLPWKNFTDALLVQAKTNSQPVMIDFFAEWCLACHELDEKTFSDPRVAQALSKFMVLKFDSTEESEQLIELRKRFKIVGLPSVIFINEKGRWLEDLSLNEFETPEKFLERIKQIQK